MTTYAGRYDEALTSVRGQGGTLYALNGDTIEVEVFQSDGTTAATLYDDRDKTPFSGSGSTVTPDAAGNVEFFADPGTYVLKVKSSGNVLRTDTVVVPVDPAEAAGGVVPDGGSAGDLVVINDGADGYNVVDKGTYQPVRSASQFGIVGDGTTDEADALLTAQTELEDTGETLYIPADMTVRVASTVDLRRIRRVECHGKLVSDVAGGPGFIFGDRSSQTTPTHIYIADAEHSGTPSRTAPTVRIAGTKNIMATVHRCDWLQVYADGNDAAIPSGAYSHLWLGTVDTHELFGENGGWINEWSFWGGRITHVIVDGDYDHNGNVWYHPVIEGAGSTIQFARGRSNRLVDVRGEGGTDVSFGPTTHHNEVLTHWHSNANDESPNLTVSSDAGTSNVVGFPPDATNRKLVELVYSPSTNQVFSTSATAAFENVDNADAQNDLVIPDFTPMTDQVIVEVSATARNTTGIMYCNLRDGSGDIADTEQMVCAAASFGARHFRIPVTVTPGTTYTGWTLGWKASAGTNQMYAGVGTGSGYGSVSILVRQA